MSTNNHCKDERMTKACPHCDKTPLQYHNTDSFRGKSGQDAQWYCHNCGRDVDDPVVREKNDFGGQLNGYCKHLDRMDVSDVPGLSDSP